MMARYGVADGVLGTRRSRLVRNVLRCVAEVAAVAVLPWTLIPLAGGSVAGSLFCLSPGLEQRSASRRQLRQMGARMLYSLLVPWIVTWNQAVGEWTKTNQPNRQNA